MIGVTTSTPGFPTRSLRMTQPSETAWQESMYRLVICPEGLAAEKIRQLSKQPGLIVQDGTMPCITLASFRGREAMEDTLIRWVQRVCRMHSRFQITLETPRPHPAGGWRMPVTENEQLKGLAQKLTIVDDYIRSCSMGPVHWETTHTCRQETINRSTETEQYLIPHDNGPFAAFLAHSLVLTRQSYAGSPIEIVNLFAFMP
jgi:hypothetical protein